MAGKKPFYFFLIMSAAVLVLSGCVSTQVSIDDEIAWDLDKTVSQAQITVADFTDSREKLSEGSVVGKFSSNINKPAETSMQDYTAFITKAFRSGLSAAGMSTDGGPLTLSGNITGFLAEWEEVNVIIAKHWTYRCSPLKIELTLSDSKGVPVWTKTVYGGFKKGELRMYGAFSYTGYVKALVKESAVRAVESLLRDEGFIKALKNS